MRNLAKYEEWSFLNELRILGMPYRIMSEGDGWKEIHREAITIKEGGVEKEIGHISFGVANTPDKNRYFALVNIETFPISGWGSHQIMTVHQSEHTEEKEAYRQLEDHWKSLSFKSVNIQKGTFPTVGFTSVNKNI